MIGTEEKNTEPDRSLYKTDAAAWGELLDGFRLVACWGIAGGGLGGLLYWACCHLGDEGRGGSGVLGWCGAWRRRGQGVNESLRVVVVFILFI